MGEELQYTAGMEKVILLFEGRTGSSLLVGLLNQCEHCCFYGEELARLKGEGWEAQRRWMDGFFALDDSFSDRDYRFDTPDIRLLGFKIKLRDIADADAFRDYVAAAGISVARMTRKNIVKQTLSAVRAMDLEREHGLFNLKPADSGKKPGRYRVPVQRFNDVLLRVSDFEHRLSLFVASLPVDRVYSLAYEDLVADMNAVVRDFCRHHGLEQGAELRPQLVKLTDDNMADALENYGEIRDFYRSSLYARYFD